MSDSLYAAYDRQPPGWYPDPYKQGFLRWWDGGRWAEATKPILLEALGQEPPRFRHANGPVTRAEEQLAYVDRIDRGGPRAVDPRVADHGGAAGGESVTRVDESLAYASGTYGGRDSDRPHDFDAPRVSGHEVAGCDEPLQKSDSATGGETRESSSLARLWLSSLFGLSLALFAAGFALDNDVLRLVALTGGLFFGVGTAPLQLSETASLDLRLCVAGLVGLSLPLVAASVMVLVPVWYPSLLAVLIGGAAVLVHAVACRRVLSGPSGARILLSVRPRVRDFLDASMACSLVGTLLWIVGMAATGHVVPGVFGFLPKAPVYWYLGLAFLIAGIMLARGKDELPAAFGTVSLLAALTLTPSVVYGMPRSESAAKHIDLVQNILQAHSLSRDAGIYQAYSGLFSAVAWLSDISGMHNITGIATYFPFFIDLIVVAGLRFLFGQLTASRYRIWVAIMLVILVNSIGADYFSPQAVGFAMAVCVFGLALGWEFAGLGEPGRIGILTLAGCAMAITHELSPYVVGAVLVVLLIFRVIRPWYVPLVILVPALAWAFLNRNVVSGFFSFESLGNLSNFAPPQTVSTPGLQRLPVVGESSDALALALTVLIVIACLGLVRRIRNGSAWAFIVSPGVGLVLIAANPYGNEGIFRAALFGIPWLAATGTQALPSARSRWASAVYGVIAVALAGAYLVSMFGLDNTNVIRPADYQALLTYQDTASPESYMLALSYRDNLPVSVDFPQGANHAIELGTIFTRAQAEITKPNSRDADALAQQYYKFAKDNDNETGELYALWSPAGAEYDIDYGLETLTQAEGWRSALIASPDWKIIYKSDGTYLFRVTPDAFGVTKSLKTSSNTPAAKLRQ